MIRFCGVATLRPVHGYQREPGSGAAGPGSAASAAPTKRWH